MGHDRDELTPGNALTNLRSRGPCRTEARIDDGLDPKAGICVAISSLVAVGAIVGNYDAESVG